MDSETPARSPSPPARQTLGMGNGKGKGNDDDKGKKGEKGKDMGDNDDWGPWTSPFLIG